MRQSFTTNVITRKNNENQKLRSTHIYGVWRPISDDIIGYISDLIWTSFHISLTFYCYNNNINSELQQFFNLNERYISKNICFTLESFVRWYLWYMIMSYEIIFNRNKLIKNNKSYSYSSNKVIKVQKS